MLTFFLYTILFWIAGGCFARYYFLAIQHGKILDVLFGYQNMLERLFSKGGKWRLIENMLGGCEMCYCSFAALLWFAPYVMFTYTVGNVWLPFGSIGAAIAVNLIWGLVYTSIQFNLNLLFVTGKLFNK